MPIIWTELKITQLGYSRLRVFALILVFQTGWISKLQDSSNRLELQRCRSMFGRSQTSIMARSEVFELFSIHISVVFRMPGNAIHSALWKNERLFCWRFERRLNSLVVNGAPWCFLEPRIGLYNVDAVAYDSVSLRQIHLAHKRLWISYKGAKRSVHFELWVWDRPIEGLWV